MIAALRFLLALVPLPAAALSDRVARIEGALTGSAGPGAVAATGPVQRQMAAG